MKKIVLGSLLILGASGAAFAGVQIPTDGTSIGTQSFKTSNNVSLFVASVAGTSLDPGGYSTASTHSSGNRDFATNSSQPKIYWRDKTTTALSASDVTCTSSTAFAPVVTSWNSL